MGRSSIFSFGSHESTPGPSSDWTVSSSSISTASPRMDLRRGRTTPFGRGGTHYAVGNSGTILFSCESAESQTSWNDSPQVFGFRRHAATALEEPVRNQPGCVPPDPIGVLPKVAWVPPNSAIRIDFGLPLPCAEGGDTVRTSIPCSRTPPESLPQGGRPVLPRGRGRDARKRLAQVSEADRLHYSNRRCPTCGIAC